MMWKAILILIISVSCFGQSSSQTPPNPLPFQSLRFEEDYSYLQDKSKRKERLDKLKYISLRKENWFLSLGGEVRIRYETYRNAAFGSGIQDKNGYFLGRFLLHSDWHLGKKFRIFAQIQSGIQAGRNGGSRPTDEDKADVHQAFFDYKFNSGEKRSFSLRVGRQEVEFGSGRLISASEGLNVRRSFDAIRPIFKQGKWTANGLYAKLVATKKGFFDDGILSQQTFWGVGAVRNRPKAKGGFSVYYLGLDRKTARFNQGAAREIRQTFGTRIWGNYKKLDYNYEIIGQTGTFGNSPIQAWALASDTGLNFPKVFSRINLKSNITSGDRNPHDDKLQSFNPLFPATAYSGTIALIGPTNVMDVSPGYRFSRKKLTVSIDAAFYRRQSKNDGLYGITANLQRRGDSGSATFIGSLVSLRTDFRLDRHITFTAIYSHFSAGQFLKDNPPDKNVEYFSTWVTYKF
jgi:Alginate export